MSIIRPGSAGGVATTRPQCATFFSKGGAREGLSACHLAELPSFISPDQAVQPLPREAGSLSATFPAKWESSWPIVRLSMTVRPPPTVYMFFLGLPPGSTAAVSSHHAPDWTTHICHELSPTVQLITTRNKVLHSV